MHKIEIPVKNIIREFPSEVTEMTNDQFLYFIMLVMMYLDGKITLSQFKVTLIKNLLDIRYDLKYATLTVAEKQEIQGNIMRLSDLCESFFETIVRDNKPVKVFKLTFTRNFIPVICGRYHGPEDALQDITFCEYRMAHSHFVEYLNTQDEMELCRMIAILYRRRKRFIRLRKLFGSYDGHHRVKFTAKTNPAFIERRARRIATLPQHVRYGIFLYYSGSEQFLATGKPVIDGKEIDLSIIYEGSDKDSDSPDIGLIGILFGLAESKVFGSIEETDNQNLYDVMVRLYQVVKQSKALEAKYNSHGTHSNI